MALGVLPEAALARRNLTPRLSELGVKGAAMRFTGDRPLFVTVAPGVEGRDVAQVLFQLEGKARVRLDAVRTGIGRSAIHWSRDVTLPGGSHRIEWRPAGDTPVGSYVMRLTVEGNGGRRVYGGRRPASPDRANAPVVRVLGVEASFTQRSYRSEERMALRVLADAPSFTLTLPPGRPRARPEPAERRDDRALDGRSDHGRLDGQALDAADDHGPVGHRLAERAVHGEARDARRTRRLRPVRHPPDHAGRRPRRGRDADEHLAGVQPLRLRRRRLGRHVVRGRQPPRRPRPAVPRPGRPAALLPLRLRVPPVAREDEAEPGLPTPTTTSRRSRPATTCGSSTTSSSSRATPST